MSIKVRKLKGRDSWYLDIHLDGKRTTRVVGKSKRTADIVAAELELAHAKGKVGILDRSPTFAECAKKWLEYVELRRKPGTVKRYAGLIDEANKHLGGKSVAQIGRGDVRDTLMRAYKDGAAKASVALLHSAISGVFSHAIEDGLVTVSPAAGAMAKLGLSDDKEAINPLSPEDMQAAIKAMEEALRPVFLLLYATGCRIGEALPLTWDDIDLRNRKVTFSKTAKDQVVSRGTKAGPGRTVEMSDDLHRVLSMMDQDGGLVFRTKNGGMMSDNTLRRKWSSACRAIGIGHRRLHDIRHTTASVLLARGAPITMVSALLGHASTKMTLDIYGHYLPSESKGAINMLGAGW